MPSDCLYRFFRNARIFKQRRNAVMSEVVHSQSWQFSSLIHAEPSALKARLMTRGVVQRTVNAERE